MKYIFILLAVTFLAFVGYQLKSPQNTPTPAPPIITQLPPSEQAESPTIDTLPSDSGAYLPYTDSVLAETQGTNRVLYFYASWCPTCRPVDKEISDQAANLPSGLTIIRVNYNDPDTDDSERALAARYNITYQHTFVHIDGSGDEISQWNGGGLSTILANTGN